MNIIILEMFKSIFFLFFPILIFSQINFSGKIMDAKTKEPLLGASIYVPNSSIGTTTGIDGNFSFQLPIESKEIVISYLGYNTINVSLDLSEKKDFSKDIYLREKSNTLKEVIVTKQKQDKKWFRQYETFKIHFLGNSTIAQKAEILNKEELFFTEISDSTGYKLIANSNKPLIIKNKAIGYLLTYDLIEFGYFNSMETGKQSYYAGYSFYQDLIEKDKLNKKKVIKNRLEAYKGSTNHFIKSVYNNTFKEEGFKLNEFIIKDNPSYPSKEELKKLRDEAKKTGNFNLLSNLPSKKLFIIGREYSKDDFVKLTLENQFLDFKNYIWINYTKEKPDPNYFSNATSQTSYIELNSKVEIFSDGNFFNPLNLLIYDYMGWKKIGDALPFDYKP